MSDSPRGPRGPSKPTPQPAPKPSKATTTTTTARSAAAAPAKAPASGPKVGLAKKPAPTTTTTKKQHSAKEVADAFARGDVTLGTALGLTTEKKQALQARAFTLLSEKRGDLALPLLEGLVALDPFEPWALTALASLKIDRGAHALALKLLDRALSVKPGDVTALALRSEARRAAGDVVGADADLASLDGADPRDPAVRRARGLAL